MFAKSTLALVTAEPGACTALLLPFQDDRMVNPTTGDTCLYALAVPGNDLYFILRE